MPGTIVSPLGPFSASRYRMKDHAPYALQVYFVAMAVIVAFVATYSHVYGHVLGRDPTSGSYSAAEAFSRVLVTPTDQTARNQLLLALGTIVCFVVGRAFGWVAEYRRCQTTKKFLHCANGFHLLMLLFFTVAVTLGDSQELAVAKAKRNSHDTVTANKHDLYRKLLFAWSSPLSTGLILRLAMKMIDCHYSYFVWSRTNLN